MKLESLNAGELFIVQWQYRMLGGFSSALMQAISKADMWNLAKLEKGFPNEVSAYKYFSTEDGWWEKVQEKAGVV